MTEASPTRCGYVAIIGRPNVGKSTFLNQLLGQKLSITSRKPHTTRYQLLGIKMIGNSQIIYVDTPGLAAKRNSGALSRYMQREALTALSGVDAVIVMLEALRWTEADDYVLQQVAAEKVPLFLAVNKVDTVKDKAQLLPYLSELGMRCKAAEIIPISARTGVNIAALEKAILSHLPVREPLFPEDQLTDRNERFFAAEFIREKLMRKLGQELPYQLSVSIEDFVQREDNILAITAFIWVERASQKAIVIGKHGAILKAVGEEARSEMEAMFGQQVFLQTWVKVKEQWSDNETALRTLGYDTDSAL